MDRDFVETLLAMRFSSDVGWLGAKKAVQALIARDSAPFERVIAKLKRPAYVLAQREIREALAQDIRLISIASSEYPQRLRSIDDPPAVLYVRGQLPAALFSSDSSFVVAIVGSRNGTPYGMRSAKRIAREITESGGIVVSGLALGVDGAAHRGALEIANTKKQSAGIGVLGSGMGMFYPARHRVLAEEMIAADGAVLSEYCLSMRPTKFSFPERNRIISGLSDAVVVVEARERSGALITARLALEQGRDVFAVPGPVDQVQSQGTNNLIAQGAPIIRNASDIIESIPRLAISIAPKKDGKDARVRARTSIDAFLSALDENEQALCERLIRSLAEERALHFDHICDHFQLQAQTLREALGTLELGGIIDVHPGDYFALSDSIDNSPTI